MSLSEANGIFLKKLVSNMKTIIVHKQSRLGNEIEAVFFSGFFFAPAFHRKPFRGREKDL